MSCTNCFNGCTETVSDQCVKYTGDNIPSLEISKGDSLANVESKIVDYLLLALDGSGIVPYIAPTSLCALVSGFLPTSGTISLNNVVDAIIKSLCSLKAELTTATNAITTLNADYNIGCLTGVTASSGTHAMLQAAITKVCAVSQSVTVLALDLVTNYVKITDIDSYIQSYLSSIGASTLISAKMVPYAVLEYYGPLTNFDLSGAGTGDWLNIYLCNGANNTPDRRGRVAVGVTIGMLGGALPSTVNPAIIGNPSYTIGSVLNGVNSIVLAVSQIPNHTHVGTISSGGEHAHTYTQYTLDQEVASTGSGVRALNKDNSQTGAFLTNNAGLHTHSMTNSAVGGGEAHSNVQPGIGCYFIQYRP
jgi:microcystin-dependent protein